MRPRLILSFLESRVLATREVGVHSYVFAACEGGILIFSSEAYALSRLVSCSLRSSCALLYLYRTRGRNSDFLFGGLCPLASRVLATCVVRVHSFIFAAREGGIPVFSSEVYALVSRVSCPCYLRSACALLYLCRTRGRNSDFLLFRGLCPRFSRLVSLLLMWCVCTQLSLKKNERPLAV